MSDEQTLNTEESSSTEQPSEGFHKTTDGLISTVEKEIWPIESKVAGAKEETSSEDAKPTPDEPATKEPPFHEHPRWQELQAEKKAMAEKIAELNGRLSAIQTPPPAQAQAQTTAEQTNFKNLNELEDAAIADWQVEKPKEFYSNLAQQLYHEIKGAIQQELSEKSERQSSEDKVRKTYEDYHDKNPSFGSMWESGEIKKFMDANPGHTAISAHQVLTSQSREAELESRIAEATQKAVKEAEEKFQATLKAKQGAKVLSNAPPSGVGNRSAIPDELKNPKKYGGPTTVMAQRLAARRAAGAL